MSKWGKCDFRQLEAMQKKLENMEKKSDEFCRKCAQELALRLLVLVIPRTPVGVAPKMEGAETVKAVGESGETKEFLSADAARIQQYWGDYTGGTLRRGWTAGKENTNEKGNVVGVKGKSGYVSGLAVDCRGENYTITVSNSVFYASYVEYGHRQTPGRYVPALGKQLKEGWVEGKFMLTISTKEVQRMAPKLLERKLQKFLKECLNAE